MKSIRNILKEEENQAHKEALEKGLKYKGFGYWMDPQTGETKYKTVNNELIPIDPKEIEDQQQQSQEQQMGMGGMPGQSPEAMSFDSFKQQEGMPKGTGENILGVSKTGEAKGPHPNNMAWDPGPDGDTFVGGQKLAQWNIPPKDSFVGKKNYYKWTAGPDGDNFKTRTYDDLKKEFIGNHDEKQRDIDAAAGKGYGAGEAGPVEPYTTRESYEPHTISEYQGADDMQYLALMNEYLRLRQDHTDSYEAQKMYDSAMMLCIRGEVSLDAKCFFEDAADIVSVQRNGQDIYREKEPKRQEIKPTRQSGYRDTPALDELPLKDLDNHIYMSQEDQDNLERERLIDRHRLMDVIPSDNEFLRGKLNNLDFVRNMANPAFMEHMLELDRLRNENMPNKVNKKTLYGWQRANQTDSQVRAAHPSVQPLPNNQAGNRYSPYGEYTEQKPNDSLWDRFELDNEDQFNLYTKAVGKLLANGGFEGSEIGTSKRTWIRGRKGYKQDTQKINEGLGKYFNNFDLEEIANFAEDHDFNGTGTLEFLRALKETKTLDKDREVREFYGALMKDGLINYWAPAIVKTLDQDERYGSTPLTDTGANKYGLLWFKDHINDYLAFQEEKPHDDAISRLVHKNYIDMVNDIRNAKTTEEIGLADQPLVSYAPDKNMNGSLYNAMLTKIDEMMKAEGIEFEDYTRDEETGELKEGRHSATINDIIQTMFENGYSDGGSQNFLENVISRLDDTDNFPAMARAWNQENNNGPITDIDSIHSNVTDFTDAIANIYDEDDNSYYNDIRDESFEGVSPGDLQDIFNEYEDGDDVNEILTNLLHQRNAEIQYREEQYYEDENDRDAEDEDDDESDEGFERELLYDPGDYENTETRINKYRRDLLTNLAGMMERNVDSLSNLPPNMQRRARELHGGIERKADRLRPDRSQQPPRQTSNAGAVGTHTSYIADVNNNPNYYGTHRIPTLDADLKKAGLSRKDLHSTAYIAWNARPNKDELIKSYKNKYDKEPDLDSNEFKNFAKKITATDAIKTWKNHVLPKLTPGTVVYNTPIHGGAGGEMREFLYGKYGFGRNSNYGQFAVVGEDGKLYPLYPYSEEEQKDMARNRQAARARRRQQQNARNESYLYHIKNDDELQYFISLYPEVDVEDIEDIIVIAEQEEFVMSSSISSALGRILGK